MLYVHFNFYITNTPSIFAINFNFMFFTQTCEFLGVA